MVDDDGVMIKMAYETNDSDYADASILKHHRHTHSHQDRLRQRQICVFIGYSVHLLRFCVSAPEVSAGGPDACFKCRQVF